MITTDPIADMLTRIRNAQVARHNSVLVPMSKTKKAIADILLREGFIASVEVVGEENKQNLNIGLKYGERGAKVISGLKRISKPGLRIYVGAEDIPSVLSGLGIAIVSTSKGILTDKEARKLNIGGEVLCFVW